MKARGQKNGSGKLFEVDGVNVALVSGSAQVTVTFGTRFPRPPHVSLVPHETDVFNGAAYSASAITRTGFTLTIAGSDYPDGDVRVEYFAAEKC